MYEKKLNSTGHISEKTGKKPVPLTQQTYLMTHYTNPFTPKP